MQKQKDKAPVQSGGDQGSAVGGSENARIAALRAADILSKIDKTKAEIQIQSQEQQKPIRRTICWCHRWGCTKLLGRPPHRIEWRAEKGAPNGGKWVCLDCGDGSFRHGLSERTSPSSEFPLDYNTNSSEEQQQFHKSLGFADKFLETGKR